MRGRGVESNPKNRFEALEITFDEGEESFSGKTRYLKDHSRSIITYNQSPDLPFEASLNPYRGCEHGCAYCYARTYHEYLGFSAGLDFETKILVKEDAPELLTEELSKKSWKPQVLVMSGVTDCYQPVEKKLQITRRCLQVLARFRNPCGIITKNHLVTRDIDILRELASLNCISVLISITTLDSDLCRVLEPRTSQPAMKLKAIEALAQAGIPVGVMTAPIIPGLTEHEIPQILEKAKAAGARYAGKTVLNLPGAVEGVFLAWLDKHLPERKQKVINRLHDLRGGKLSDSTFGVRMTGEGFFAEQIRNLFNHTAKRLGFLEHREHLTVEHFRRDPDQLALFQSQ